MRTLVISDVHGMYDKMVAALEAAHFNPATDRIVVAGDICDRGRDTLKCMDYINHCPNRIVLLGNHDVDMIENLTGVRMDNWADKHNGRMNTVLSFVDALRDWSNGGTIDGYAPSYYGMWSLFSMVRNRPELAEARKIIQTYYENVGIAFETRNYVITHAWLPYTEVNHLFDITEVMPDWRTNHDVFDWGEALWYSPYNFIAQAQRKENDKIMRHAYVPCMENNFKVDEAILHGREGIKSKYMVVGHVFAAIYRAAKAGRAGKDMSTWLGLSNDTFLFHFSYHDFSVIAIDGCAVSAEGKVNVFEFDDDDNATVHTSYLRDAPSIIDEHNIVLYCLPALLKRFKF